MIYCLHDHLATRLSTQSRTRPCPSRAPPSCTGTVLLPSHERRLVGLARLFLGAPLAARLVLLARFLLGARSAIAAAVAEAAFCALAPLAAVELLAGLLLVALGALAVVGRRLAHAARELAHG